MVGRAEKTFIDSNTITNNGRGFSFDGGIVLSRPDGTVITSNIVVGNLPQNFVDDRSTNTLLADNTVDAQTRSPTPAPTPPPTLKPTPAPTLKPTPPPTPL